METVTLADGTMEHYSYDHAGNVCAATDGNNDELEAPESEKEVADHPAKNIPLAEKTMGIEQNKSIRQYADAPAERTSLKAKLEMMKAKVAGGETEKSMPQKIKGKEETYEIF